MKRILIVEDEKALRDAYVMLFTMKGFEVHEAINGKEALNMLLKVKPDIIILDLLMPIMGGLEFLQAVNWKQDHHGTKVLVLSNLSDRKTIEQVLKLGASDYLLKSSVSPSQLIEAVSKL